MIIKSLNNLTETAPKTYLSNTEAAGTTVFRLRNSNGIGSAWAIQIGETGEETAEVLLLSGTPSGTLGTSTAASRYEHPADTPLYGIKWNQVVFERSTAGTSGTATAITDGTVTITPDNYDPATKKGYTLFDDTTGSVSYAYRTYFRNSSIPLTSSESDWIVVTPNFYSLAILRDRVKNSLWNAEFVTDNTVDNWINEWKDEMTNALVSVNEDYAIGTVGVGFGTNGLGTVTTTDFKQPRKMEITYDAGVTYTLSTKQHLNEFDPNQTYLSSHPYHNWQGDNIFKIQPADSGGTAIVYFYRLGTPMVNDTDELPFPMRGYTKSFVDYGLGKAYQKDGKPNEANTRFADAFAQKQMFVNQSTPRDKTSTEMIELVENVSSEEDLIY